MRKFAFAFTLAVVGCHRPAPTTPTEPVAAAAPGPLTDADRDELTTTCKPLFEAIAQVRSKRGEGTDEEAHARIEKVFATPPAGLSQETFGHCKNLFQRAMVAYIAESKEIEAVSTLRFFGTGESEAFEQTQQLCPSAPPTPATTPTFSDLPRTSTESDWSAPGWVCAHASLAGEPSRFQYEARTDAAGVTLTARALLGPDRVLELSLAGHVEGSKLVFPPKPTRVERPR